MRASAAKITTVASSATSVTLLSGNPNRVSAVIVNNGTSNLYVALGNAAASASSYTYKVAANGSVTLPVEYAGAIQGLWDVVNGNALITELTD